MAISRRALGLGLVGLSALATGAVLYGQSSPLLRGYPGEVVRLTAFTGGEKEGFFADPDVTGTLRRSSGLEVDARRAGSIEMVRERSLLDQNPQFLWPSSPGLVDLARASGVKVRRDQVILNSPLVVYSWDVVAKGLATAGLATADGDARYRLKLGDLLKAILDGRSWAEIGVPSLYGK